MKKIVLVVLAWLPMLQAEAQGMLALADGRQGETEKTESVTAKKGVRTGKADAVNTVPQGTAVAEEEYRWEFWSGGKTEEHPAGSQQTEKVFGREIACLLHSFGERFIKKEQVAAGDPMVQTVVRKPAIYNAVRNIEKHYRRKYKARCYTGEDSKVFEHVVKVALASVDSEGSEEFEEALQEKRKSVEEQIGCFKSVKLNYLY